MSADATPQFDLVVSIDRSDATLAVALLCRREAAILDQSSVSTTAEALETWWSQLQRDYPNRRIAVAFEQPAPGLLAFFAARSPAVIYALNPAATWAYRRSLTVSRARNDPSDARDQAWFVHLHHQRLRPWRAPAPQVATLERFCLTRRKLVDERTTCTNRLQEVLKRFYPQALAMMHEHWWRPMNLAFLRRWPTPAKLQRTPLSRLRQFYRGHGSRSDARWQERTGAIKTMVALGATTAADELEVQVLVDQIEVLNRGILRHDQAIAALFAEVNDEAAARVAALPGAGPILAPRIYVALAQYATRCDTPESLAAALGIAPVTDQSGKMRKVHRRLRCDTFTRQTFIEWVSEAWKHSVWARAFYQQRKAQGQRFHVIMRALAYKWIRILWRCWHDGVAYDESKYLTALQSKGSSLVPAEPPLQAA